MTVWHKTATKDRTALVRAVKRDDKLYRVLMHYPYSDDPSFEISAGRWDGPVTPDWQVVTEEWVGLRPNPPLRAQNWDDAVKLETKLLTDLERGKELRCEEVSPGLCFTERLDHSSRRFVCQIYQRRDGSFELRFFKLDDACGHWHEERRGFRTYAGNLDEARSAGRSELGELAERVIPLGMKPPSAATIQLIKDIIVGNIGLYEGCEAVEASVCNNNEYMPDSIFVGIVIEFRDNLFPVTEQQRSQWNPEALERELQAYKKAKLPLIQAALERIEKIL